MIKADNRRLSDVRFLELAVADIRDFVRSNFENHRNYDGSVDMRIIAAVKGNGDPSNVLCAACAVGSKNNAMHDDPLCKGRQKTQPWLKKAAPHLRQKLTALATRVNGDGAELQEKLAAEAPPVYATVALLPLALPNATTSGRGSRRSTHSVGVRRRRHN